MNFFEKISEEKLREAIHQGKFDELDGMGKPLPPETYAQERNENTLAFDLLKKNGFLPDWVEERKSLLSEIERIRNRAKDEFSNSKKPSNEFREKILKLNQRILNYNLRAPVPALQINEISLSGLANNNLNKKEEQK